MVCFIAGEAIWAILYLRSKFQLPGCISRPKHNCKRQPGQRTKPGEVKFGKKKNSHLKHSLPQTDKFPNFGAVTSETSYQAVDWPTILLIGFYNVFKSPTPPDEMGNMYLLVTLCHLVMAIISFACACIINMRCAPRQYHRLCHDLPWCRCQLHILVFVVVFVLLLIRSSLSSIDGKVSHITLDNFDGKDGKNVTDWVIRSPYWAVMDS